MVADKANVQLPKHVFAVFITVKLQNVRASSINVIVDLKKKLKRKRLELGITPSYLFCILLNSKKKSTISICLITLQFPHIWYSTFLKLLKSIKATSPRYEILCSSEKNNESCWILPCIHLCCRLINQARILLGTTVSVSDRVCGCHDVTKVPPTCAWVGLLVFYIPWLIRPWGCKHQDQGRVWETGRKHHLVSLKANCWIYHSSLPFSGCTQEALCRCILQWLHHCSL